MRPFSENSQRQNRFPRERTPENGRAVAQLAVQMAVYDRFVGRGRRVDEVLRRAHVEVTERGKGVPRPKPRHPHMRLNRWSARRRLAKQLEDHLGRGVSLYKNRNAGLLADLCLNEVAHGGRHVSVDDAGVRIRGAYRCDAG